MAGLGLHVKALQSATTALLRMDSVTSVAASTSWLPAVGQVMEPHIGAAVSAAVEAVRGLSTVKVVLATAATAS